MTEESIECPCYRICSALGIETGSWCHYRKSDVPPPGMHNFDPKSTWCDPGVQANIMMLAHLITGQGKGEPLDAALAQVRESMQKFISKKREEETVKCQMLPLR
jgi:hypothetical protein